jgi:alpha-D-ribose 1-methylphosphonate 5-triphosphate diphosphatase
LRPRVVAVVASGRLVYLTEAARLHAVAVPRAVAAE